MSDQIKEVIQLLIQGVLLPVIIILTKYLVSFLNNKIQNIQQQSHNEKYSKYLEKAERVICDSVKMVAQTYVSQLKATNSFDTDAQKEALQKAKQNVLKIIDDETLNFLQKNIKDFDTWLETKIESSVCQPK